MIKYHHYLLDIQYLAFIRQLATQGSMKVCSYDRSGRMFSTGNREANATRLMEELNTVVNDIQAKKVVLIGHSLGGLIGTAYTITFPQQVQHLVLLDPAPTALGVHQELTDAISTKLDILYGVFQVRENDQCQKLCETVAVATVSQSF